MSDKELEEYIRTIEPNFDSHLEKGTIEMNNEYYNLLEERIARLINENQELKKQLKENKLNHKQLKDLAKIEKSFIEMKNQQKEFIKWLEDYLKLFDNMCIDEQGYYDMLEEILQKYKNIIGDDKQCQN